MKNNYWSWNSEVKLLMDSHVFHPFYIHNKTANNYEYCKYKNSIRKTFLICEQIAKQAPFLPTQSSRYPANPLTILSPSSSYTLPRKTMSWLTLSFPILHLTFSDLSISCESSISSLRPGACCHSHPACSRPDVSSDIASPVQPTQNRWSPTSTCACLSKLWQFSVGRKERWGSRTG